MKYLAFFVLSVFLITSCRNDSKTPDVSGTENADSVDQDVVEANESPGLTAPPYTVEIDETTQQLRIVKNPEVKKNLEIDEVVASLNAKYPGIQLALKSPVQQTTEVEIADASQLTQQMGTAGAETFLAEVTFSLTEIPGIEAVKFSFEEGDHARPGIYTRKRFKALQ